MFSNVYGSPYERGIYGQIGDRFSFGLEGILVIGDLILDVDEFHTTTKTRDGYKCLAKSSERESHGGAGAVAEMVKALGCPVCLATDNSQYSLKTRIIADGQVLCRIDKDRSGKPPKDLPPAALVLIADYRKGVVTEELINRIAKKYRGKEIIADVHPDRGPEFYHCATAIKASWNISLDQRVPVIRTHGAGGITLQADGFATALEASAVNAIDPCGAGDMVLASLGVARLQGKSWLEAAQYAQENAAKVCQHWGAIP